MQNTPDRRRLKILLAGVGIVAFLCLALLVMAVTMMFLWNWFVAPLGPPNINLPVAAGLILVGHLLTSPEPRAHKDRQTAAERIGSAVGMAIAPLFLLLLGYIIQLLWL